MWQFPDSDWTPSSSGGDAPGCWIDGSNHPLKSSTHCQSFILHHNVLLSLHLNHFLHIVMTSLDFVRPNTRGNIRRKGSTLDNGQERMWELPGRVKLILGDRRLQSSAFCSSPSCWYGKMHVRHSFFRWAPPRNMALKTCHRMLSCKNDRRSSGGTLRQKFNLNDILHSTFN